MTQQSEDLALITAKTLEHYNEHATEFWEGTRDHDVKQNIEALLRHIRGTSPLRILDFGCGPGRDMAAFHSLGHEPIGLEGSPPLAAMAREHSGCEVWEQDFLALKLPAGYFDGIFANASLFHVPRQELPRVLNELHAALKPEGVLFSSNPRGNNEEGWNRGRYGVYHDFESWRVFLERADFTELEHYYRPPGLPRERQPWLASVWRRNIVSDDLTMRSSGTAGERLR
ncbi:MAG: class I SAM-dependent methyltransferase [Gammaproteobacteria bacterium]|nr:MAG: class I SAM-dependent methyltransferase [Gammaproteobacteria bacterium]